jgi:hypothetical protein
MRCARFIGASDDENLSWAGYGSGRSSGGPTVENALQLDIDGLMKRGVIQPGARVGSSMRFRFYDGELDVGCEAHVGEPWDSFLRLRYGLVDYWTGEQLEVDDKINLATTRPKFGGLRWWFICPRQNRRVRKLYLAPGGRHFWSRQAYRLTYTSQRGTAVDRAHRGQARIKARLIADLDPDEWDLPPKPKWMRWATYQRLVDKYDHYEAILDQGTLALVGRWMGRSSR